MPRATRAALRAQETTTAASIVLPPTPTKGRVPLGEISDNAVSNAPTAMTEGFDAPDEKPAPREKKSKGGRKGKKQTKAETEDNEIEIVGDDSHSSHSDAVDEACNELLDSGATGIFFVPTHVVNTNTHCRP